MHTLKMRIFLHKVVGFLQIASVSMVTSRLSGRYLGVNTGLLAAQEHRYRCGQRPLEYTMSIFYFTAVTFQYFKVFLVKEGSFQTCSAPEWHEANSNNLMNLSKKPVTEEIQSVFTGQLRTSSMAATGSLLYRRHWLYGGERVLVKALPATWWEIPARPQQLHGSAET